MTRPTIFKYGIQQVHPSVALRMFRISIHQPLCAVALIACYLLMPSEAVGQPGSTGSFLRVSFIDVGQGDAIWIQGPPEDDGTAGANIIIDGGPDRAAKNRLIKYLEKQSYGLEPGEAIDCVIATHPHDDHYPGLMDVLAKYEVRHIVDSGFPKPLTTKSGRPSKFATFRQAALKETADGKTSEFVELRRKADFELACGSLEARIIHADSGKFKDLGSATNTRENNASTVVKLTFGSFSFLFMGDAEGKDRKDTADTSKYVEQMLLDKARKEPDLLRSTVLKVGHHGSETGSTLPFIRAVTPDVIVVMSGRKSFGGTFLPDKAVIERYQRQNSNVVVLRTDEDDEREGHDTTDDEDGDDVYMYTDGDTLKVYKAVGPDGRRRWQLVKTLRGETE
jgi:competence protein ComEC